MDPTLGVAIIGAIASILIAVIANRFTSRSAMAAQRRAQEMETTKVDAEAYKRARENYDAALEAQNGRIASLQLEMSEDRGEYRQAIADLKERIRELEAARRNDQLKIRTLIAYMRDLIALLRVNHIEIPVMPTELDMEIEW
jgi:uncharacterized membrane-anchored protein YhcB (DUF1043 family)